MITIAILTLIWFVVVMLASLSACYGLSRILMYAKLVRPSDEGYLLPDREHTRAYQILRRQIPYSIAAFVIAFGTAHYFMPWLMRLTLFFPGLFVSMGLIEGGELNQTHGALSIFFSHFMLQVPAQLIAYWFAYRHAAWVR